MNLGRSEHDTSMRRFAIGDIHGCMKSLRTLIEIIDPQPDDELIFLGDYVDRGPDSRNVVDQLIALQQRCKVIPLRGNHEIMLQGVALGGLDPELWLANGGLATITSYGGAVHKVPQDHIRFFQNLLPYYETDNEIFVHACYEAHLPMNEQRDEIIYWTHLSRLWPQPHCSGKRVFVGHTPQGMGNVLDLGYLVCLDTYCFGHGYLTAMNLDSYETIQVDYHGHLRRPQTRELFKWIAKRWHALTGWAIHSKQTLPQDSTQTSDNPSESEHEADDSAEAQRAEQDGVPQ